MASNPENQGDGSMPGRRTNAGQRQATTNAVTVMARMISAIVAIEAASGLSRRQINAGLRECLNQGLVTRIVVTDEHGTVEYSSDPNLAFAFPNDPTGDGAEFLKLLDGSSTLVVQPAAGGDGSDVFQDVAVRGRDKPRIVQLRHRWGTLPDDTLRPLGSAEERARLTLAETARSISRC